MSRGIARHTCWFAAAAVAMLIAAARTAEAGAITYAIQNYPADQEGYTLSGTITTDGVIGGLAASDIVSWSWTISYPGEPPVTFSSSDPQTGIILDGSVLAVTCAVVLGGARNRMRFCRRPAVEARAD
jgi:hypothetical protein